MPTRPWRIWIDTGGTFTDCLGVDPFSAVHRLKVLSTGAVRLRVHSFEGSRLRVARFTWNPNCLVGMKCTPIGGVVTRCVITAAQDSLTLDAPWDDHDLAHAARNGIEFSADEQAPVLAARLFTGTPVGGTLPPIDMRLATTRGTNALLERSGSRVAFFVTRGHRDVLRIGTQQRPDLFALRVVVPEPLHADVVEVEERIEASGEIVRSLDLDSFMQGARRLLDEGYRACAVALMHAWINPDHERHVARILRQLGFANVSVSSDLSPTIGLRTRAETAVVNAYLSGPMEAYLTEIQGSLHRTNEPIAQAIEGSIAALSQPAETNTSTSVLHILSSAGGLVPAHRFHAKDSLLSGPAGGVIGAAAAGRASGYARVISFDMGGTSTDVARIHAEPAMVFEHGVAGARIASPAVAVHSVAAGGGSICRCVRGELHVGPQSACASPGPACYARGGPMTITDANLLLGRFDPALAAIPVSPEAAEVACESLRQDIASQTGRDMSRDALLHALIDLADERMADAIREVSIREGYDASDYVLVAFGGAGGQHACGVASRLGIGTIVVPHDAGLLSAVGLGAACGERVAERQVLRYLDGSTIVTNVTTELEREAVALLAADGHQDVTIARRIACLRLVGQESSIPIEFDDPQRLTALFEARYEEIYGHPKPDRTIEVESIRVIARSISDPGDAQLHTPDETASQSAFTTEHTRFEQSSNIQRFQRMAMKPGQAVHGPALIIEPHCTTYVAQGWQAELDRAAALVMRHHRPASPRITKSAAADDLLIARLGSIAREMGEQLRRSAVSTNVKERLDYSCAILDSQGMLVVSAPHVPVHLGALGECVRAVRTTTDIEPGDVVVTNHPAYGGSHLPDITVITPVFDAGDRPLAFVASRAHHAEIGGIAPGSMPAQARTLDEEGVIITPMHLVKRGTTRYHDVERILNQNRWPSRRIADNLADLHAAVAANHRGAAAIAALSRDVGRDSLQRAMKALLTRAASRTRELVARLGTTPRLASDTLDDGWPIAVRIIGGDYAVFDFNGTGGVHPGGFNATPAIVRSAVMYVLRLLVAEPMPLNEGLTAPVEIVIPRGLLNPDFTISPAPAVAAGNTETSQRLVNLMLRALGAAAESQGTMNNVLFGDATFGYYETIGGGCGAGPDFDGASAVHSHMTNTRITDAEILEHRFPARVERFEIRRGSGGAGRHCGGDGIIREVSFLHPLTLSVITQRRIAGPAGLHGGSPGSPGTNTLIRARGNRENLASAHTTHVHPGDRLVIETPGGGGCGYGTA